MTTMSTQADDEWITILEYPNLPGRPAPQAALHA